MAPFDVIDGIGGCVPVDDDLIGTAEAAAILGTSVRALSTRARRGSVPCVRRGDGRRTRYEFRRADILAEEAENAAERQAALQTAHDLRARTGTRLVGTAEAAAILGVNRWTVIEWATRGRFPAYRYVARGKTTLWRFERAAILAFAEANGVDERESADE